MPYRIDLGPNAGGFQSFETMHDVTNFFSKEILAWQEAVGPTSVLKMQDFLTFITRGWRDFQNAESQNELNEAKAEFIAKYSQSNLISVLSPIGRAFKEVAKYVGLETAADILLYWRKNGRFPINVIEEDQVAATLFLVLTETNRQQLNDSINALENYISAKFELDELIASANREISATSKNLQDLNDKANIKRKELEETYEEKLRLKAPANYWSRKARSHCISHLILSVVTGIIAIAFTLTVWNCGPLVVEHAKVLASLLTSNAPLLLKTVEGQKYLVTLSLASIGLTAVLASTLAIWTLRYLVRMMISENHLKSDSEIRSVMIATYLALKNESTITEKEDRQIILRSIFTPPTDGLLKDDGLPIATQLGMLASRPGPPQ
jgi:hypothetical protein